MTRTRIARTIDAPVEVVFEAVADASNFSKAVPDNRAGRVSGRVEGGRWDAGFARRA